MFRRLTAAVVAVVVTGFAYLLLTGRYPNDGPVLVSLTATHGLHAGDLVVVAGWLVAMAGVTVLTGRR